MPGGENMNELVEAFAEVFDPEGHVLNCGRDKCKKLIFLAQKNFPNASKEYYGDETTGWMNSENLLKLRSKLSKN
jgi:hypothetical protein